MQFRFFAIRWGVLCFGGFSPKKGRNLAYAFKLVFIIRYVMLSRLYVMARRDGTLRVLLSYCLPRAGIAKKSHF